MTFAWNPRRGPTPEQLVAFTDDDLTGQERAEVEAWLAAHPEAAARVAADQRLNRLWQETQAAQPSAAAWAGCLDRVRQGLAQPRRSRRLPLMRWLGAVGAAAMILGPLLLGGPSRRHLPPDALDTMPFPVASDEDVNIISMDMADIGLLVVGAPPVDEKIVVADHSDVQLLEQRDPDIHLTDWITPMIVDPRLFNY